MLKTYILAALLGTCSMMQGQALQQSSQNFQGIYYGDLATGDLNGDGKPDFLVSGAKPGFEGFSQVYFNENGQFSEMTILDFDQLIHSAIAIVDIDNDGKNDILITGTKTATTPQQKVFQIYMGTGFGGYTKKANTGIAGVNNGSIQVADFNGDGRKDILVNGNADQAISKIYLQNEEGDFEESAAQLMGSYYSATKVFDANGDGHQDILITGFSTSYTPQTKLYINSGTGEFTEITSGLPNLYFSSIDAADFDNDGNIDILISGMDMVPSYKLGIFLNDGEGHFTELQANFLGTATGSTKFVDYNNDGHLDVFSIGTTLANDNKALLYKNQGDNTFALDVPNSNVITALNMGKAAWFDYNDDERLDLLTIGFDGTIAQTKLYTNTENTNCSEPGENPGDLGCVQLTYKGEQVTYTTVRGSDGNIWLQQNLGSSKVAESVTDEASYGDLFQWGRWDDGHQSRTSATIAVPSPNNPIGIAEGAETFYTGTWWTPNALTDKWEASTPADADATNGCDPCKALGAGWKIPTETEWRAIVDSENMANPATAYASLLKLPANGNRSSSNGNLAAVGQRGYYWSTTPSSTGGKYLFVGTTLANPSAGGSRGQGSGIRCMKYKSSYCEVSVDHNVEPITSVVFANIDNTTSPVVDGTPAYEDFTSIVGNVRRGESYDIRVQGNTVDFEHDIRVFFDWNSNGTFEMDSEYYPMLLAISTGTDGVTATQSIQIPDNAVLGNIRMRIIKDQWTAYEEGEIDACLNAYYGQVEDYTISVQESLGTENFAKNSLKIYPNPTSGILNIQTDLAIENVSVYNQLGQLIRNQKSSTVELSNATSGIYMVKIKFENGETVTQKIIKK